MSLFSWAIVSQISGMHFDTQAIIQPAHQLLTSSKNVRDSICCRRKSLSFMVVQASSIGQKIMTGVSDLIVNLAVAIMFDVFHALGRSENGTLCIYDHAL